MVRLAITLTAERHQLDPLIAELDALIAQARADQGLIDGHLSIDSTDPSRLYYVEEWLTEHLFRDQIRSERFRRLIRVVETAPERPRFDLQLCLRASGLDYVEEALEQYRRHPTSPRQ